MFFKCYIGFCHIKIQISHNYTSIPSVFSLHPLHSSHPSRSSQNSTGLLHDTATSHQYPSYTWSCIYADATFSIHLTPSPLCPQVHSLHRCLPGRPEIGPWSPPRKLHSRPPYPKSPLETATLKTITQTQLGWSIRVGSLLGAQENKST